LRYISFLASHQSSPVSRDVGFRGDLQPSANASQAEVSTGANGTNSETSKAGAITFQLFKSGTFWHFLCSPPAMIKAAIIMLAELEVNPTQVDFPEF
jgi:hypothetical protein